MVKYLRKLLSPLKLKYKEIKYREILNRNRALKDLYKGKRCFVVGNGSSLKEMDLRKLKGEFVFTVNDFPLHPDFEYIAPGFYSSIEPIKNLQAFDPKYHYYPDNYYPFLNENFKHFPNTKLFFSIESKDYITKNGLFQNHEVYYLLGTHGILADEKKLKDDLSGAISFNDGVIYATLCLSCYMGFEQIYFIGCDCDWYIKKSAVHFFNNIDRVEMAGMNNEEFLYSNFLTLKKWRIITTFFKNKGVNIMNAGVGGENDTCERVDFNSLFQR